MNLTRLFAVTALLALLAAPAHAQPKNAQPTLNGTSGLTATSSRSPIGFTPPTAATIGDYVKAVGAVEVNASFHASQDTSSSVVTVRNGADVSLHASFSKKDGAPVATLDGMTLTANGVDGPLGTTFQKAEIHADGSMTVKLNSWIPEIKIDGIERQPDGEITLKGPWYTAPLSITKDGDIMIGQKDSLLGQRFGRLKVGHIDPRLLVNWPPRLDDVATIAANPDPNDKLLAAIKDMAKVSAGGLSWDVRASADGLPVTLDGAPVKAKEALHLHGAARLGDGQLTTVGDKNQVNVQVDFAPQQLGDANAGVKLDKAQVKLDGAYRLSVPLADTSGLSVAFDGAAAYSVSGDGVHLTLPNKGRVSVGRFDLDGSGGVHVAANGPDVKYQLDDSRYAFAARGPVKIEKLGPISKLDLDGELRSKGLVKIGAGGLVALHGDLGGSFDVQNGGTLNRLDLKPGFYARSVRPGSRVDVKLDEVFGAVQLPVGGSQGGFQGADARGHVAIRGDLGDVTVNKDGVALAAPVVHADVTADGRVKVRGSDVSGEGDVKVGLGLPKGARTTASVGGAKVSTSLDPGSHVDLNAHVSRAPSAPAPSAPSKEVVLTKSDLNIRKGPSTSTDKVGLAPKGTKLEVLERSGNWVKVKAPDGTVGWVATKYTMGSSPNQAPAAGAPTIVNGRLTGELGATNGTLDAGGAHADLQDRLRAKVSGPVKATISPNGTVDARGTNLSVPVRIDLKRGTKINYGGMSVTLTEDGNYATFVGQIALDANGKPKAQRLSNVDVQLNLGGAKLGWFQIPAFGSTHFKGDVTFGPGGAQVHGNTGFKLGSWEIFDVSF